MRRAGALAARCLAAWALLAPLPLPAQHAALDALGEVETQERTETNRLIAANGPTLDAFEAALAARPSATSALQGWCEARHYSREHPATIHARRFALAQSSAPPAGIREQLEVSADEPLRVRHVALTCGDALLSLADNWYVPSRLSPAMNRALDTTDTPFGTVAAPLHFTRQPLSSQRGAARGCVADAVLSHRALLRLPDGHPLALVMECYEADVVAPPGVIVNPPAHARSPDAR